MIAYFADRKFNILGQASTQLPAGILIKDDLKSEDVETGIAIFDGYVQYTAETREQVENFTAVGNYILRKNGDECEFYTIIESEANTKNREVYVYAEDAGLDLINEVVGTYEADKAYPITHYIEKFAYDSGFEIGINEAVNLSRKLSWDGEATVTERLASVATQFDCEISYSFDVKGLEVTHKYINIYKKRGKDLGIQLRLNYDIDNIVTKKSIANLATGLEVTGGTPENEEDPITLKGYKYDDGDFFVSGTRLYSRKANQKWSRYIWNKEPNKLNDNSGYIVKTYSYDTTSQSELCAHAVTELKKICDIEVNYEVEIAKFPDNVRIGDRVDIVDDAGGLYASARVLKLESSAWTGKNEATIGEFLIKTAGISQKVLDLAEDFAKTSVSAERARKIAEAAKQTADAAQTMADEAVDQASTAQTAADAAQEAADTAQESAGVAQEAANQAQTAVGTVEENVKSLQTTVETAQTAAENAYKAAETAGQKADQAAQAAADALEDSAEAKTAADAAQETAESAVQKSDAAQDLADTAKTAADAAKSTAEAAKQDAQTAQDEIDSLGERLTTVSTTMEAEYARKTDLTEAEASLQTQISQNAAQISSTASKVEMIDETANDAADKAAAAQTAAGAAQSKADQAAADAAAAQSAADTAKTAAENAQKEADTAHSAAQTAQGVADKAKEDLDAAKADLATVQGRVDATEEDIAAAQAAVDAAQVAADKAQEDADAAVSKATAAQTKADNAAESAQTAQEAANDAASKANLAQQVADEAKGDAAAAQATAEAAQQAASTAQNTANTAKNNAAAAQSKADAAAQTASAAQTAADEADAKAAQAAQDLATAQQNLASVTSRVDATEEEVAAAQAAVDAAQTAADQAKSEAQAAQNTADTAKNNATLAQQAADAAKDTADAAQEAADQAQEAADQAQAAVDALAVRVTDAETNILQNAEAVEINASKTEEIETNLANNYYSKTETDAKIKVESDRINSTVSKVEKSSITSTVEQFYLSSSPTSLSGGSWSTTQPTWTQGKYIWRRTLVTKGDGTQSYTPSSTGVCITGNTGANGKGTNLVRNGYGEYLDNTNFETWGGTFTRGDCPEGCYGYFTNGRTELIPFDPNVVYRYEYYNRLHKGASGNSYFSIIPYDVDGFEIGQHLILLYNQNLFYLAKDLKDGDTVVYFQDLDAWKTTTTYDYQRSFLIFGYKDSTGYLYPDGTYSRYYYSGIYADNNSVNKANNTITLKAPWSGGTKKAGTCIAQTSAGSTYCYYGQAGDITHTDWKYWTGKIYAGDDYGSSKRLKYAKTIAVNLYNNVADYAKISIYEDVATGDEVEDLNDYMSGIDERVTESESQIEQLANSISMMVTDENGQTLMEQTSTGWRFNIGSITASLEDAISKIQSMSGAVDEADRLLSSLNDLTNAIAQKTAYIIMATDDSGKPCIELGKGDDPFKVRITNTSMDFMEGSSKIAYISNKTLYIERVVVKKTWQMGDVEGFAFEIKPNGDMAVGWVGD